MGKEFDQCPEQKLRPSSQLALPLCGSSSTSERSWASCSTCPAMTLMSSIRRSSICK